MLRVLHAACCARGVGRALALGSVYLHLLRQCIPVAVAFVRRRCNNWSRAEGMVRAAWQLGLVAALGVVLPAALCVQPELAL